MGSASFFGLTGLCQAREPPLKIELKLLAVDALCQPGQVHQSLHDALALKLCVAQQQAQVARAWPHALEDCALGKGLGLEQAKSPLIALELPGLGGGLGGHLDGAQVELAQRQKLFADLAQV